MFVFFLVRSFKIWNYLKVYDLSNILPTIFKSHWNSKFYQWILLEGQKVAWFMKKIVQNDVSNQSENVFHRSLMILLLWIKKSGHYYVNWICFDKLMIYWISWNQKIIQNDVAINQKSYFWWFWFPEIFNMSFWKSHQMHKIVIKRTTYCSLLPTCKFLM